MYKTRMKVFLVLVALTFVGITVRLVDLQIVRGHDFRDQYEEMLRNTERLDALRGRILDRNGFILAMDEPCYDLCLDYRFMTGNGKWVARERRKIIKAMGVTKDEARAIYKRRWAATWRVVRKAAVAMRQRELQVPRLSESEGKAALEELERTIEKIIQRLERWERKVGMPVVGQRQVHPVVAGLDEATAVEIKADLDGTVGAVVRPSNRRRYPYGPVASHVIGFTTAVWEEDAERYNLTEKEADWFKRNEVNYLDGDHIGRSGVEKMCEKRLRGSRGYRIRRSGKIAEVVEAKAGQDVHLRLDIRLQRDITMRMAGRSGCAVVLSIPTREVLAMVSLPTYDPNHYRRDRADLEADRLNLPLWNRAVKRMYPPGSTMKPIAALAALSAGLITPETVHHCRGYLHRPGRFRCWKSSGHGDLDLVAAIQRSCNVYFYSVGEDLGVGRLGRWYRLIGFGDKSGTGLPEERAGKVPVSGTVGEARLLAIGQGPVAVTPLHVANAIATVAASGRFHTPVLVPAAEGGPRSVRRFLGVSPEQAAAVQEGMYNVVNKPGGTAYKYFQIDPPSVEVCGKTGTAETWPHTADLNGNGRIDPGEKLEGSMAWCVAFAPYGNAKIALAVVLEYVDPVTGSGPKDAAPVARDIIHLCQKYGYLK